MRRAGRVDANQASIVEVLRFVGASVAITSGAGDGFPDLLVGWMGETHLLEVKDGAKRPSKRRLTPAERYFADHWQGRPVVVVESEVSALEAIGLPPHVAEEAVRACRAQKARARARA